MGGFVISVLFALQFSLNAFAKLEADRYEPYSCHRLAAGFDVISETMALIQGTFERYIVRTSALNPKTVELRDARTGERIPETAFRSLLIRHQGTITLLPSDGGNRFVFYYDQDDLYRFGYFRYRVPVADPKDVMANRIAKELPLRIGSESKYLSGGTVKKARAYNGREYYVVYRDRPNLDTAMYVRGRSKPNTGLYLVFFSLDGKRVAEPVVMPGPYRGEVDLIGGGKIVMRPNDEFSDYFLEK